MDCECGYRGEIGVEGMGVGSIFLSLPLSLSLSLSLSSTIPNHRINPLPPYRAFSNPSNINAITRPSLFFHCLSYFYPSPSLPLYLPETPPLHPTHPSFFFFFWTSSVTFLLRTTCIPNIYTKTGNPPSPLTSQPPKLPQPNPSIYLPFQPCFSLVSTSFLPSILFIFSKATR